VLWLGKNPYALLAQFATFLFFLLPAVMPFAGFLRVIFGEVLDPINAAGRSLISSTTLFLWLTIAKHI
jgi:hypothetical protein